MDAKVSAVVPEITKILCSRVESAVSKAGGALKIILPDGTEYGSLEVVVKKPRAKRRTIDRNGFNVKDFVATNLRNLEVGDVAVIPTPKCMTIVELQSAVASFAHNSMGPGALTTHRNGKVLEAMRVK